MAKRKTKETKVKAASAKKGKRTKVAVAEPVVTTSAPAPVELSGRAAPERETRNGVKRPAPGGLCAAVWDALDKMHAGNVAINAHAVRDLATAKGFNQTNASIEMYQWRKFMGLSKPRVKKAKSKGEAKAAPPATRVDGTPDAYLA